MTPFVKKESRKRDIIAFAPTVVLNNYTKCISNITAQVKSVINMAFNESVWNDDGICESFITIGIMKCFKDEKFDNVIMLNIIMNKLRSEIDNFDSKVKLEHIDSVEEPDDEYYIQFEFELSK